MADLSIRGLTHTFGGPPLFDNMEFHLETGDRLCLIGRNGCGKSSFLKILTGQIEPDQGEVIKPRHISWAFLGQEIPPEPRGTALEWILDSLQAGSEGRADIEAALLLSGASLDPGECRVEAEKALTLMEIDPGRDTRVLSGGELRRVLLAGALAAQADILLLDEPTNHLDMGRIEALEEALLRRRGSLLFVTHDRAFARRLSTRVAQIDRGSLFDFPVGYDEFIRRREELMAAQRKARAAFDKKLAEEEAWIRKGIKARRTRNEGRVKALKEMREAHRQRREEWGRASLSIQQARGSGKRVAEAEGLSFGYTAGQPLIQDLDLMVMRGDHFGIAGPSGSGKTTLIRLLLGELSPTAGRLERGVRLEPVYLDQLRTELDEEKTVWENLAGGYETLELAGGRKHVLSYLKDFLFQEERSRSPVSHLSGGEKNRLLLAKLFARPSNVLILDEPTNDLDVETLELLEEKLQDYPGTLFLVSHDREFLDNVITDCLILPGDGRVHHFPGGYGEWRRLEGRKQNKNQEGLDASGGNEAASSEATRRNRARRLTFKEKRELQELPDRIAALEAEQAEIHQALSDPELYREDPREAGRLSQRLEEIEQEMEKAMDRWEILEGLADELKG